MTTLEQACDDLTLWLPHAAALLAQPDTQPTTGRSKPGSQPPWNTAVANALFDALEGIREIEANMRGRGRRPHAHTGRTLASIVRLAAALDEPARHQVASEIDHWTVMILQLPAIQLEEQPVRLAAACPRCGRPMLRYYVLQEKLACLGCQRHARLATGPASGLAQLAWDDGELTIAPEALPS